MATTHIQLSKNLILFNWCLDQIGESSIIELGKRLHDPRLNGLTEEGGSRYLQELLNRLLPEKNQLKLVQYDQNIITLTQHINKKRNPDKKIKWLYFQYLALLFTEIYFDRLFDDSEHLLRDLDAFRIKQIAKGKLDPHITPFTREELWKLAYWQATGSGKTLQLHANILQIRHYLAKYHKDSLYTNWLLITPNEGLSSQHLKEMTDSGIDAVIFNKKSSGLFESSVTNPIQILEITKLKEVTSDETIAVSSFGQTNIVFVDEGHRGASGDSWKSYRDYLAAQGLALEYSATFGQAVGSVAVSGNIPLDGNMFSSTDKKTGGIGLLNEYAKSILFDYSYKFFYKDGFGKEYRIFNLKEAVFNENKQRYLVASLLTFYQQLILYLDHTKELCAYKIEKPLMVFVGGSVSKKISQAEMTDVVEIIDFIRWFIHQKDSVVPHIKAILEGTSGLLNADQDIFSSSLSHILNERTSANDIYDKVLAIIFNVASVGDLEVVNIKNAKGEIGLRVGKNDFFGVINVGDDSGLMKLLEARHINTKDDAFGSGLFGELGKKDSKAHLLIGSRKFTEGWNSFRVSSMGLLNIGKSEGTQIIQLFGRGVRLCGYGGHLVRSSMLHPTIKPDHIPEFVKPLETINVFGIKANYMEEFRKLLKEEGLSETSEKGERVIPTTNTISDKKLKIITIKKDKKGTFKEKEMVIIENSWNDIRARLLTRGLIQLDVLARLDAIESEESFTNGNAKSPITVNSAWFGWCDFTEIYYELVEYKNLKGYSNLKIPEPTFLKRLLSDTSWYELFAPSDIGKIRSISNIRNIQNVIARSLCQKLLDYVYTYSADKYYSQHREYSVLDDTHESWVHEYKLIIDEDHQSLLDKLDILASSNYELVADWQEDGLKLIKFSKSVYIPLIHVPRRSTHISVNPVALNEGEEMLVSDLRDFALNHKGDVLKNVDVYLMRNISKKGLGFFEANNFYPDFILWLVKEDKQHILFLDPKGVGRIGIHDPKVEFHKTIKVIEKQLGDTDVTLDSFILSVTPLGISPLFVDLPTIEAHNSHNIFLIDDQRGDYIEKIIRKILM